MATPAGVPSSGFSGFSGSSEFSGFSGFSEFSGFSGLEGFYRDTDVHDEAMFGVGVVVVVVQFVRGAVAWLVATFGEPGTHGVPRLFEFRFLEFKAPNSVLAACHGGLTDFAIHFHIAFHDEAGVLTDLLNTRDRGVVMVHGNGFGSGRDQSSGACPFEQFFVGLSNLVERAHVPAVDQLQRWHLLDFDGCFHHD